MPIATEYTPSSPMRSRSLKVFSQHQFPARLTDREESLFRHFAIRSLGGFILYLSAFRQALHAGLPVRSILGRYLSHGTIDIPAVHAIMLNSIDVGLSDAGRGVTIMRQ